MSGSARRRWMAAIVGLVLLWPIVHAVLVARFRIDPWELFGWSMYALPPARVQVQVELEREGETEVLRAMGETRRRVQAFARRRTALGRLAATDPLARMFFAEDPSIDAVIVVTREILLDPETSRLVFREERHRHERKAPR